MDGNVDPELEKDMHSVSTNKIKININKIVSKIVVQSTEENTVEEQQPEIVFDYKKSMEGISFQNNPTWTGGHDMSGLCSIM